MTHKIYLFADGSCGGKGMDIGAWAACVVAPGRRQLLYGTAYPTTINRCELTPILAGLKWIRGNIRLNLPVRVFTDSEYTAKAASGVFAPEENLDLWASYRELAERMTIEFKWRERNSHFYMELCDALASTLRRGQIEISSRLFPDWKNPEAELPTEISLPEEDNIIMRGVLDAANNSLCGPAFGNPAIRDAGTPG